jgi:glycerophosphoryl diester phosphodiesterase
MSTGAQQRMEGLYAVSEGGFRFGEQVVLQWSWTRSSADTTYTVSIFSEQDAGYIVGQGRWLGDTVLLNMYWQQGITTETGLCRMRIRPGQGAELLRNGDAITPGSITIDGSFGDGQELPERPLVLRYLGPVHARPEYEVLAHRCGGRNEDALPASENSVEMILLAPRLGATGVEMDVRLTSDGVPVLYHDNTLNARCIQPCGLFGPLENYSYAQLDGLVRLVHGERIPTLREALTAVVDRTGLRVVWLDTKAIGGSMPAVHALQLEFMARAAAQGRAVRILIGLPDDDQVAHYLELSDQADAPALCEGSIDQVHQTDAEVWAPRWTLGLVPGETAQMHAEGRRVFTWTLDVPDYIRTYIADGDFDGMLSNYSTLVAYYTHALP